MNGHRFLPNWLAAWPSLVGVLAAVLGVVLLGGAQRLADPSVKSPREQAPAVAGLSNGSTPAQGEPERSYLQLPHDASHLEDLRTMFAIGAAQGIRFGKVDYRVERVDPVQATIRVAEFQMAEDYPKVKALLAELTRRLPHCFLQEIKIDRKDHQAAGAQVTLRLAFVYRSSPGS